MASTFFNVDFELFEMQFVDLPAGSFMMGTACDIHPLMERMDDVMPGDELEHEVHVLSLQMSSFLVTRRQFGVFVRDTGYKSDAEKNDGGSGWDDTIKKFDSGPQYSWRFAGFKQTDNHPVINVSWNDARAFCAWVSGRSGQEFALPTEAQWEYACRAGSKTLFSFGDDEEQLLEYGNVQDASFRRMTGLKFGIKGDDGYAFTSPVGSFKPNNFGLYDMHGNVWEWCEDYRGKYQRIRTKIDPVQTQRSTTRVLRGGSWFNYPSYARSAMRLSGSPELGKRNIGFRVVINKQSLFKR